MTSRTKDLKGTQTATNLMTSFAGESQAFMRYKLAADVAREEGYIQISEIFMETALNECEHANIFYKYLRLFYKPNQEIEISGSFPVVYSSTKDNLYGAALGEYEEANNMYPEFAEIASQEGFPEIAQSFREIAKVESAHEDRFSDLMENVQKNEVFKRDGVTYWKCKKCGYIYEGEEAPTRCPACDNKQKYFELYTKPY